VILRIVNVFDEATIAAKKLLFEQRVVIGGDDDFDWRKLRERGVNRARRAADVELLLQRFFERLAIAVLRVEKIFRDFEEIVNRAVGVLALFREPLRQLFSLRQAGFLVAVRPAKSRTRARAEKRQASAGFDGIENQF
jgi:hypothetical protein